MVQQPVFDNDNFFLYITLQQICEITLAQLRNIIDESFGILPAKTRICDGFAVHTVADLLAAFRNIAFHHEAFDKRMDVRIKIPVLPNLPDDPALLDGVLAGLGMVDIISAGFRTPCPTSRRCKTNRPS